MQRISSPRTALEDELTQLLDSHVASARDRQLVRRVLGWDGQGGCVLAKAGDEVGITRERARQVFHRAIGQIRACELSPCFDQILVLVHRRRNRAADDIQAELQLRRFTRHRFGLRAICDTARVFGRAPEFVLEEAGGKLFVVAEPGTVRSILKAATRSSRRHGLQTVAEICRALAPDCGGASGGPLVRQVLSTRADLRWLDARQQWFWLAAVPQNPVVGCIKKLLHFAGSVCLADIQQATRRLPRKRTKPISREALLGFCRQAPFCRLRADSIEPAGSIEPGLISRAEAKVCRILKRNGNQLKFGCLQASCAAVGVSRPNLWRILRYSPLIFRRAPQVYAVVTPATPGPSASTRGSASA